MTFFSSASSNLSSSFVSSSSSSSSYCHSFRASEQQKHALKVIIQNCRRHQSRPSRLSSAQRGSGNSSIDEGVKRAEEEEEEEREGEVKGTEELLMSDSFDEADLQARERRQMPKTPEEMKASLTMMMETKTEKEHEDKKNNKPRERERRRRVEEKSRLGNGRKRIEHAFAGVTIENSRAIA